MAAEAGEKKQIRPLSLEKESEGERAGVWSEAENAIRE